MSTGTNEIHGPEQAIWQRLVAAVDEVTASHGYRYPDPSCAPEDPHFEHRGRKEELEVWRELVARCSPAGQDRGGIALDAGCGTGVYTPLLTERFAALLSVDADPDRLRTARSLSADGAVPSRFLVMHLEDQFFHQPALTGAFDFVQCVQVLGHVPIVVAGLVFKHFGRWIRPGGHLLLAVPLTNQPYDRFLAAERGEGDKIVHRELQPFEFDALCAAKTADALPIRHFSMPAIRGALRVNGFSVVAEQPYNWFSHHRADLFVLARKEG